MAALGELYLLELLANTSHQCSLDYFQLTVPKQTSQRRTYHPEKTARKTMLYLMSELFVDELLLLLLQWL